MKDEIRTTLEELANANGGQLTAQLVVSEAKKKDSPLHDLFDWDQKSAARKHWLYQARALIRSVKVEITNENHKIRCVAYVRDPDCPNEEQGYVSVLSIKTDKERARDVLLQEFGRAAAALERAHAIAAVLEIQSEVSDVMERVNYLQHVAIKMDPDNLPV